MRNCIPTITQSLAEGTTGMFDWWHSLMRTQLSLPALLAQSSPQSHITHLHHMYPFFGSHLWMSALEARRSTIWAPFPKPLTIYAIMLMNAYLYVCDFVCAHFFIYLSWVCGICETEFSTLSASHYSHPPELPQCIATYLSAVLLAGN